MNALFVAGCAALTIAGLFTGLAGFRSPGQQRAASSRQLLRRWHGWPRGLRVRLVGGVSAGLLVALVSGFLPAILVVPAAVVVLPQLLRPVPQPELELLEALDRWIRTLGASVGTGKSVADAIRSTRGQAPARLAEPIRRMVARLDDRWPLREALQQLADELDSADTDAVIAALVLVAERGGVGASSTLAALSAAVQDRLRALREVGVERSKPQVVVQQVTVITLTVLGAAVIFSPSYFEPYRTPLGQLLLVLLAACYLGAMLALRRIATPRRRDRILLRTTVGEFAHG